MPAPETDRRLASAHSTSQSHPWSLGWRVWLWQRTDLAVGAALAVLLVVAVGIGPATVSGLALAVATPVLWRVDVAERRLPNALVLPIGCLALGGLIALGVGEGAWPVAPIATVVVAALFFGILSIGGGMGMGDAKLAIAVATVLALVRVDAVIVAALVAFGAGGVAALVVHVRSRQRSIPFGPFLLVGFWTALVLSR
jgi:leader peptidase (prepilin peptidase)/N-methyltransferase